MKKLELSNDVMFYELDELIKTPDDAEDLKWALYELPMRTKLDLVRDYNQLENPSLKQSAIIVALAVINRERVFDKNGSKEVAVALDKCAQTYAKNGASDKQKRNLGWELKHFVIGHPENASAVLDTLDKYLTDVDVIEPIRSCMSRDYSLLDKGFEAIHKSADAVCAKAEEAGKNEAQFAVSERIRVAFADLYCGPKGSLDSAEIIDKITSYFPSFENQIYRNDAKSLHSQCEWMMQYAQNDVARHKAEVLRDTFLELGNSDKPFEEIYASKTAKRQDELERLTHKEEVTQEDKTYTADDLNFVTKFNPYTGKTGQHAEMRFKNGFGVSVITPPSYDWGKYELAVLDKDGKLCYSTDVTNEVEVVFDKEELTELMLKVQNLDSNGHLKEKTTLEKRKDQIRKRLHEREQCGVDDKVSGLAVNDELVKIHDSIGTVTPEKAKTLSPIIKEAILEKRKHKK